MDALLFCWVKTKKPIYIVTVLDVEYNLGGKQEEKESNVGICYILTDEDQNQNQNPNLAENTKLCG